MSPQTPNSEPPSLTESMQLMDEILSDARMDRLEKIERLEAILSAATSNVPLYSEQDGSELEANRNSSSDRQQCTCSCHNGVNGCGSAPCSNDVQRKTLNKRGMVDVGCQTLSTGEIVITRIFFKEEEKEMEKTIMASPKKVRKNSS
ncbi:hypothetical protein PR048_004789 [Dryococelus australis]|uniref:Uncharacterized protein n=1 Tax=Dryococelus australis TaxID=614101 RepID=A0ABQ9I7H8_9NEOP|nr:hypothetical protein PR048_004789 [Dryococelus australis]